MGTEKRIAHQDRLVVGVLVLLSVATFLMNVADPFVSDDWVAMEKLNNQPLAGVLTGKVLVCPTAFRPLADALSWVEASLFGLRPFAFHLMSLLLGALVSLFAYALAKKLFGFRVALLSLLVFAVAPAHVENLAWISGRADVLAALLLLAGLWLHVHWRQNGGFLFLFLGVLSLFLALQAKEVAMVSPLLLLLVDRHLPEKPSWKSSGILFVLLVMLVVGWLLIRNTIINHDAMSLHVGLFVLRDLFRFIQLFFLPFGFENAIPWVMTHMLAVFGALLVILAGIGFFGRRLFMQPAVRVGLVGGLISLIPVANLYPRRVHVYLASVWFAVAVAGLIDAALQLDRRWLRRVAMTIAACWLVLCLGLGVSDAHRWHKSSQIAARVVADLAATSFSESERSYALVLTVPDHLREAFIMRNGLHQALRLSRPDLDVVVHPLALVGLADEKGEGLSVRETADGPYVIEQVSQSAYACLLPPDANRDLHLDDIRVIGPAGYRVLAEQGPFCISIMEVAVDQQLLEHPRSHLFVYRQGRLVELEKQGVVF